jgi:hypothetical protein
MMNAITTSKYWSNCLVFITFDEHGGRWDHVPPPKKDRWGPGIRIPTIAVSPLVKKGYVEKTSYDTTAIMKMIQDKYGLRNIGTRDRDQNGFENIFIVGDVASRPWMIVGIVIASIAVALLFLSLIIFIISTIYKRKQQAPPVSDDPNAQYYRVW